MPSLPTIDWQGQPITDELIVGLVPQLACKARLPSYDIQHAYSDLGLSQEAYEAVVRRHYPGVEL